MPAKDPYRDHVRPDDYSPLARHADYQLAGYPLAGFSQAWAAGGYYSQAAFYPQGRGALQPGDLPRPLRVIHVGQYMVRAGIEIWLRALIRLADPRRLTFERCIVTSPLSDRRVIEEMPVPVEIGGEQSVRKAA